MDSKIRLIGGLGAVSLLFFAPGLPWVLGQNAPPVALFSLPRSQLRSFAPSVPREQIPARETFNVQTRSSVPEIDLLVQRHATMNGAGPLRPRPAVPDSKLQRTIDLFLPRKATLFQRNPNARRNPLEVDGW